VTEWKGRATPPICRRCVEVVRDLKREWLAFFDEVPSYFEWVSRNVDAVGELVSFGDGMIRGGLSFTDGSNHGFQHLLACGAKRALWLITREMYADRQSPLYGSRVNAFFHDEVFAEQPEDLAPLAGPRQAELMVQGLKEYVPDVHVVCEPALMRRWSKAAEPVWVDGKLTVWEPKA
jgi:DNA polymerase-1